MGVKLLWCAALMGPKRFWWIHQTDTKPSFITVSTFDINKGHSCPSLLCIFMHLWPQSIRLGRDIKLRCYKDGSPHCKQQPFFTLRGSSKHWIWWGGGGWGSSSETSDASEGLCIILVMLWEWCQDHFGSPVCVTFSLPKHSSPSEILKPLGSDLSMAQQPLSSCPGEQGWSHLLMFMPGGQRCRQVTEGNNVGSGYPPIRGYTWSYSLQDWGWQIAKHHQTGPVKKKNWLKNVWNKGESKKGERAFVLFLLMC